jgi:hypothetical protein
MGEFDEPDLLRGIDTFASLPRRYAFAVGTNRLGVWDGVAAVRRGLAAGVLGCFNRMI